MARENIYQSLEVFYEHIDSCLQRDRQFNFFEMIYVISGIGNHVVNENIKNFAAGDLLLITPNDCHEFNLQGVCEFMVIRFGAQYIKEFQWKSIDHIECLLYYASHLPGSVLSGQEDQKMVASLIQNLRQITISESVYNEDISRHLVNALIVIAARNIAVVRPQYISAQADHRILLILEYIQKHIRFPKLLKADVMAEKFGFSPTYLGSYFQKHCNESVQQYISSYKIRLIEHRLRFSDKRIHEIADEFGFADESHINKFFKRHKGQSLKAFRMESTSYIHERPEGSCFESYKT
ncbi:AraC family transcriptional regulator [Chryseobacterium sp.]|uniref:AraC family transcriptional regulator n=1 Tax=Chryseobacterium sp. TaxID=1871047 RepID=UPI0025C6406D|nr:AraC family transcriptional regulator [Chryseobacterium sp.]MBV8326617.1 helix-turn-helix domain-containing protein [Chryseobacterium sp.]